MIYIASFVEGHWIITEPNFNFIPCANIKILEKCIHSPLFPITYILYVYYIYIGALRDLLRFCDRRYDTQIHANDFLAILLDFYPFVWVNMTSEVF